MKAMQQGDFKLSGKVDVDESSIGGKEPGKRGRSKGKKREFVIGVQMLKTKIVRAFAHQIQNASTKEVKLFLTSTFLPKRRFVLTNSELITHQKVLPNMIQQKSKPEQDFKLLHREIMMLKAAIRESIIMFFICRNF